MAINCTSRLETCTLQINVNSKMVLSNYYIYILINYSSPYPWLGHRCKNMEGGDWQTWLVCN